MLKLSTDVLEVHKFDKTADAWILANAVTGNFVSFTANGVGQSTQGDLAMPIYTESNRDGTAGFTDDVGVTGNVTVLYGKMKAVTDQFTGTPAIGDKLYVNTDGKLGNAAGLTMDAAAEAAANVIAICSAASATMTYLGRSISVIEFVTV